MADTDRLAKELAGILRSSGSRQTKAYDTPAVVRRVDGSTAWVHIPGGVDETPVQLTVAASAGDTVQVRVSGGSAWLVGNASAPPTDDAVAKVAAAKAEDAAQVAEAAETLGAEARQTARAAAKIAADTEQHFWFTETGGDTGAHITEVTQEDFLADPDNGGGNLLARSNGIAVRDGLAELAQFDVDGVRLWSSGTRVFEAAGTGATQQSMLANSRGVAIPQTGAKGVISLPGLPATGDSILLRIVLWPFNGPAITLSYSFTSGTVETYTQSLVVVSYDGAVSFSYEFEGGQGYYRASISVKADVTIDAPFFTVGTRAGASAEPFSAVIGESLYAGANEVAVGRYNVDSMFSPSLPFSVGTGTADNDRATGFAVDWYGNVTMQLQAIDTPGTDAYRMNQALQAMGKGYLITNSVDNGDVYSLRQTLVEILERLSLFGKELTMSNNNWSSGTCTVTDSSKYFVYGLIVGGALIIAVREPKANSSVRGTMTSGSSSSGNYNQYTRTFGASTSGDVWTLEWAKQLSHVTSSGYHTSGTEQAVTKVYGIIPMPTA